MGTVLGPSSMLDRLLTSRPIRIEDGCDVGGRRKEERAEARRRDRLVFLPAPRGPYCLWHGEIKNDSNATRLPRILHSCHYTDVCVFLLGNAWQFGKPID
ncbi:hypothetical protein NDU88_004895 [Pleurodeles waltl]|uniref:Uncharacterized protein n=1 Tax=Pleurodeles waltl TaxID=8319 RepID=A0AAV7MUR1_PLEWA|nr:hypothetical protein NDU88_004895 [Pleurodeles waltl]